MTQDMDRAIQQVTVKDNMDALVNIIDLLPTISKGLAMVEDLRKRGVIDSMLGLVYLLASTKDILSDDMINGLGTTVNSILGLSSLTASSTIMDALEKITMGVSSGEFAKNGQITGTWSLLKQLKDPEVQKGLTILINSLKVLGKQ